MEEYDAEHWAQRELSSGVDVQLLSARTVHSCAPLIKHCNLHSLLLCDMTANDSFAKAVKNVKNVKSIDFVRIKHDNSNDKWCLEAIEAFCHLMRKNCVETLRFDYCATVPEQCVEAIYDCKSLKTLHADAATVCLPKKTGHFNLEAATDDEYRVEMSQFYVLKTKRLDDINAAKCRIKTLYFMDCDQMKLLGDLLSKYRGVEQLYVEAYGSSTLLSLIGPQYPLKMLNIMGGGGHPAHIYDALCQFLSENSTLNILMLLDITQQICTALSHGAAGKNLKVLYISKQASIDLLQPLFPHLPCLEMLRVEGWADTNVSADGWFDFFALIPHHVHSIYLHAIKGLQMAHVLQMLKRPWRQFSLTSTTVLKTTSAEKEMLARLLRLNAAKLQSFQACFSLVQSFNHDHSFLLQQSAFINWQSAEDSDMKLVRFLNHRNKCIVARARHAAITIIAVRKLHAKRSWLSHFSKDIVALVAQAVYNSCRFDAACWWWPQRDLEIIAQMAGKEEQQRPRRDADDDHVEQQHHHNVSHTETDSNVDHHHHKKCCVQ